ncbi:MAG: homoserine O-succinyltransferase [Candidatus Peregrinibacteria bacterium]
MSLVLQQKLSSYPLDNLKPEFQRLVLSERDALAQEVRPLHIGILNLMPTEFWEQTEQEWLQPLSESPLQVVPHLIALNQYDSQNSDRDGRIAQYYEQIANIKEHGLDGLIITGANIMEGLDSASFKEEFTDIINWARQNIASTLLSCWSAHAGMELLYGVKKERVKNEQGENQKAWGVFAHTHTQQEEKRHFLASGMDDRYFAIHSRNNRFPDNLPAEVQVLIQSEIFGRKEVGLAIAGKGLFVFSQNHPEYKTQHLDEEKKRDAARGGIILPENYYLPNGNIENTWRANSSILFKNWIEFVYQNTHEDIHQQFQKGNIHFS